jgi:hypothetical protein
MIQVQLEPEVEAQLASEAHARGVGLDEYIQEILANRTADLQRRERAVQAMLDFPKKHRITLGDLDLKSLIHEGHKY